jgi:phosphatidylserine synthase
MHAYDCKPCGFRAEAHGDEESIAVRSCPRCGRRNVSAVARFFGIALAWSFAAIVVSAAIAHHSDWRSDVTLIVAVFAVGVIVGISLARTAKWRSVRSRVVFVQPPSRRATTPKSSAALPQP